VFHIHILGVRYKLVSSFLSLAKWARAHSLYTRCQRKLPDSHNPMTHADLIPSLFIPYCYPGVSHLLAYESNYLSDQCCTFSFLFILIHTMEAHPYYISPHCAMTTSCAGLPSGLATVRVFSILVTTSMPSMTLPNTTCLPFRWGVPLFEVMMKN
jgi:hypothetical protein